jgi:hypothetical protein
MSRGRTVAAAFFLAVLLLGTLIHRQYGLAWDEPVSQTNGEVSLAYIVHHDPTLWAYSEKYYGVAYELPFAAFHVLTDVSPQQLYFIRHLVTFYVFVAGTFVFFLLCKRRWNSVGMGVLGAACFIMSPRIFADAFYNSKDIPAMVLFIVAGWTLLQVLHRPSVWRIILHSLASALLIAIRLPGLLVPALTVLCMLLHMVFLPEARTRWKDYVVSLVIYVVCTSALVILFWPFLWQNTAANFLRALSDMSQFSRQAQGLVLYLGQYQIASQLPWHYIPLWILISTPLLYVGFFFIGSVVIVAPFLRHFPNTYRKHSFDLYVLAWFFAPIIAVIVLNSIVYDGWRHLYFVYPALLYIALIGFDRVRHWVTSLEHERRTIILAILGFFIMAHVWFVGSFMIQNHPYQNVYFNALAGSMKSARRNFDLDYWGLSFRKGLEYIAATDTGSLIPVYFSGGSMDNTLILSGEQRRRFRVLATQDISEAKYVLNNYRWQNYDSLPKELEIFTVNVRGESIMSVYKR